MPPVRLFGRPWHFSCDDLAIPAATGVGFYSAWSIVILVELVKLAPTSIECSELYLLQRFAVALLIFFLLTALNLAAICIISLRGSILEQHQRWALPYLVYAGLASKAGIIGINIYGTYLASTTSCTDPLTSRYDPRYTMNVLVYSTWAVITLLIISIITLYAVHHDNKVKAWETRCSWLTCCSCGINKHSASMQSQLQDSAADQAPLHKVAQLLALAFGPLQFTLTDISMAMLLVGVWHRSSMRAQRLWHRKASQDSLAAHASTSAAGSIVELPGLSPKHTNSHSKQASGFTASTGAIASCASSPDDLQQQQDGVDTTTDISIDMGGVVTHSAAAQGRSISAATGLHSTAAGDQQQHHPSDQQQQQQQEDVHPETLQQAAHFMQFALGVYGWMMHIWANRKRGLRCCTLCFGRSCGCCCHHHDYTAAAAEQLAGTAFSPAFLQRLTRSLHLGERLTREAIQQIAGLEDSQLLYVNYTNALQGVLPYFVALDPSTCSIVVAVRGTLTLEDCLTDLLCMPAAIQLEGYGSSPAAAEMSRSNGLPEQQQQQQLYAHEGMYRCSTAILADLQRHRIVHDAMSGQWQALQQRLGPKRGARVAALLADMAERAAGPWQLALTGHSLGAGVAALLALPIQAMFPGRVRCWCFSPPGALMSPDAAALLEPVCTSVVIAKDMIPRLGVSTTQQLCDQLMLAAALCKVPKAQVMLSATLGKVWQEHELFHSCLAEAHPAVQQQYKQYLARREEQDKDPQVAIAKTFIPPGRVLYLQRSKQLAPGGVLSCGRPVQRYMYRPRWCTAAELVTDGLVVAGSMFLDHFPDAQLLVLQHVADEARSGLKGMDGQQ